VYLYDENGPHAQVKTQPDSDSSRGVGLADGRISRRKFLTGPASLAGVVAAAGVLRDLDARPVFAGRTSGRSPKSITRWSTIRPAWEGVYRNQYSYDRSFTYVLLSQRYP
jgi:hypothetical protein